MARVAPARVSRISIEHSIVGIRGSAFAVSFGMTLSRILVASAVFGVLISSGAPAAQAKPKVKPVVEQGPVFDRGAAASALSSVDLVKCKVSGGPRGSGHVSVTFAPAGSVSDVAVDGGPYVKSPVGRCIVSAFQKARVPAFTGEAVKVGKAFRID